MRLLAAWLSNPQEYWMNLSLLVLFVAVGVFALRRIQASRQNRK